MTDMSLERPRAASDSFSSRFTPVRPWPATGTVDEHARAEQVRSIYGQALGAQAMSLLVAALMAVVVWQVGDHGRVLIWFGLLAASITMRSLLVIAYRRTTRFAHQMPAWERRFALSLAVSSAIWGVGGWWIMPGATVQDVTVYFFLLGIASGAVALYAAHPPISTLAIILLMAPATIAFALEPVLELRALAAAGVLYVVTAVRATRAFGFYLRRNFELQWELQRAYDRANELARTDDLTGLNNRRAFTEQGAQAMDHSRRYGRALSAVMFDIDHFKKINDTYGHAAGDAVLRAVADAVRLNARGADVTGRLGGEEFALLLPETPASHAGKFAERLRRDVAALRIPADGATITFTCSFGVAERTGDVTRLDVVLNAADQALYRAKREGRNRVTLSTADESR